MVRNGTTTAEGACFLFVAPRVSPLSREHFHPRGGAITANRRDSPVSASVHVLSAFLVVCTGMPWFSAPRLPLELYLPCRRLPGSDPVNCLRCSSAALALASLLLSLFPLLGGRFSSWNAAPSSPVCVFAASAAQIFSDENKLLDVLFFPDQLVLV